MANSLTLTNANLSSSTAVRLLDSRITYGWKNMNSADPFNTGYGATEVVHNGWENPLLTLVFHLPIDNIPSGTMTWALWNEFVKSQVTYPTGKTYLNLIVGNSNVVFTDYSQSSSAIGTSSIPVRIDTFDLVFGADDSKNANFWTITAKLMVDKE